MILCRFEKSPEHGYCTRSFNSVPGARHPRHAGPITHGFCTRDARQEVRSPLRSEDTTVSGVGKARVPLPCCCRVEVGSWSYGSSPGHVTPITYQCYTHATLSRSRVRVLIRLNWAMWGWFDCNVEVIPVKLSRLYRGHVSANQSRINEHEAKMFSTRELLKVKAGWSILHTARATTSRMRRPLTSLRISSPSQNVTT